VRLGDVVDKSETPIAEVAKDDGDLRDPFSRDLALFQAAVEAAGEAVVITSPDLDPPGPRIAYVNPAFTRLTGYAPAEVIGQTPRILQGPKTERRELDRMRAELSGTGHFAGEAVNYRKDGSEYVNDWRVTAVRDEAGRVVFWVSIQRDVTERKEAERRQRLLVAELQHRVRNTLAVIRAIARRTARTSTTVEGYAMHLDGRIDALARVQGAVTRDPIAGVDLESLVAEELIAHAGREDGAVHIAGPPVRLQPKAAEAFGLAIHELATNAVKYGALSSPHGRIRATWRVERDGSGPCLAFEWKESGIPDPPAFSASRFRGRASGAGARLRASGQDGPSSSARGRCATRSPCRWTGGWWSGTTGKGRPRNQRREWN
jgi:PAS domain S-box-containing protein